MALETAVVPRDTRLAHLERSLAEKTDIVHELRQQRSMYLSQISDANQRLTEMESRMASLQSTIQEKDSLIQMLQQSFLDPDDCSSNVSYCSQEDPMSSSLHHSPVSAKKFSLNGAIVPLSLDSSGTGFRGINGSQYDQLSLQIPPPPVTSYHYRFTNGAHARSGRTSRHSECSPSYRGYPIDLGSPVKGYSNISLPSSPVKYERSGSLSPIKRPNDRGTHKYYTLELANEVPAESSHYYRGQLQPAGGNQGGSPVTPTQHKLSLPTSSSAPNSPNIRKVYHKPRTSQPSLHHIHAPIHSGNVTPARGGGRPSGVTASKEPNLSTLTRLGSPPKYRSPKGVKSNTGDMRRNDVRPLAVDMEAKSKTPPPNHKLHQHHHPQQAGGQSTRVPVGGSGGNSPSLARKSENGGSPHLHHREGLNEQKRLVAHQKQRHHSVDDALNGHEVSENGNLNGNSSSNSLALFESLIGDSLPKTSSLLVGNGSGRGKGRKHAHINSHRHSKSSPTRELIQL